MENWLMVAVFVAFGAAFAVWQSVTHMKHHNDLMLDEYRKLLEESRSVRAKQLGIQKRDDAR